MFSLLFTAYRSIAQLFDLSAHPQQDRDERYLAESADIYDLERRMRQLDSGRTGTYQLGATGIFTR